MTTVEMRAERRGAGSVAGPGGEAPTAGTDRRFAWLVVLFAAWILGGLVLVVRALNEGLATDVGISPYHVPFYVGIVTLAATLGVRVVRALRAGRPWREAIPSGYGVVGVGSIALLTWPIVELGWREGVGIRVGSIEDYFAPSRVLLLVGIVAVTVGPLRARLLRGDAGAGRWAAVMSAALIFTVVETSGFGPAGNDRMQVPLGDPDDSVEIWVMDADGTHQTRLIEGESGYDLGGPVWSPDGTAIAYERYLKPARVGAWSDDSDIWVATADGTDPHLVVTGFGWQWLPQWSPDGRWLLYTTDGPGGPAGGSGAGAPGGGIWGAPAAAQPSQVAPVVDVWRIRADGTGTAENLTDYPGPDRSGVYSPDGRHIAFDSTREGGRPGIYVMDADGSNVVRLTSRGDDWGAAWSPDGTRIAFNSEQGSRAYDLFVVAYPGPAAPVQVTTGSLGDVTPCFSPDGSRIAFVSSYRTDSPEIWSMKVDGTDLQNLSRTPNANEQLVGGGGCWGPNGQILFTRGGVQAPETAVHEDLAAAGAMLVAALLAVLVVLLVHTGAPFGGVAVVLGASATIAAATTDEWRFVPLAILGGLAVDVLVRLAPPGRKALVAGAGSAVALVLGAAVTVLVTDALAWSPTLTLGVATAAGLLGAMLSAAIAPFAAVRTHVTNE